MNPDKVYDVTPQTRAQILREMLSGSDDRTRCKNVQVEGMFDAIYDTMHTFVSNASLTVF